jgi:error-prone DNA polymerase
VAVEVRGPDSARALLPPGAGARVERVVDRLLPHGLSHVDPIENELLLGRFLNEELTRCRTSTSTSRATSATC